MALIVLSDPHFADGSRADDFGPSDSPAGGQADCDLMDRIDQWKRNGDRVALAGDIFDLWQCPNMKAILAAHGNVIRALFELVDVYVAGNHDEDLVGHTIQGVRVLPYAVVRGRKSEVGSQKTEDRSRKSEVGGRQTSDLRPPTSGLWIEHGHAHDPDVSRFPRTCRAISWLGGWLERKVHRDVDLWAERAARFIGGTGRHGGNERYAPLVALRARAMGCQTAVFGHTHQRGYHMAAPHRDEGDRTEGDRDSGGQDPYDVKGPVPLRAPVPFKVDVFNSGTWTNGKRDYVRIG